MYKLIDIVFMFLARLFGESTRKLSNAERARLQEWQQRLADDSEFRASVCREYYYEDFTVRFTDASVVVISTFPGQDPMPLFSFTMREIKARYSHVLNEETLAIQLVEDSFSVSERVSSLQKQLADVLAEVREGIRANSIYVAVTPSGAVLHTRGGKEIRGDLNFVRRAARRFRAVHIVPEAAL